MSDFLPATAIYLQPNDVAVPYRFVFEKCSAAGTNDGSLPYNDDIASTSTVVTHMHSGEDGTSEIVAAEAVATNVVTLDLTYPTTKDAGPYKITITATLDSGAEIEFDFSQLMVTDR